MDTTAGEDFIGLCDQKRSHQHFVPGTEILRIYDDLKTLDKSEGLLKICGIQE
jgi:hypothetical protein